MMNARKTASRQLTAVVLLLSMLAALCAFAEPAPEQDTAPAAEQDYMVRVYVDRLLSGRAYVSDGILRFSPEDICTMFGLSSELRFDEASGRLYISAPGLSFMYAPEGYVNANGRYLYCPEGFLVYNGKYLFSMEIISQVFGLEISIADELERVDIPSSSFALIQEGGTYYASRFSYDDISLMAHIIQAEAGYSSLEGMIAIGNVITNRVKSEIYPNSILDVIYQPSQFEPVMNNHISDEPNELCWIATYLALDGYSIVQDAIYFFELHVDVEHWLPYREHFVAKIGYHKFYR